MLKPSLPTSDTLPLPRVNIPSLRVDLDSVPPRIALYSPGMIGLGHMRRNLLVAQVLAASPLKPNVLMIAEAREASAFPLPPGVDLLTLPALRKDGNEECRPRNLDLPVKMVSELRRNTILTALISYKPDVLIVDHLPRGAIQELDPSLQFLRDQGQTYCILGLRDVLDEPEITERKWRRDHQEEAIRSYFDAVWVYGDPKVYDLIHRYRFSPDIRLKMEYIGYLDQRFRLKFTKDEADHLMAALDLPPGQLALCMVGGGQDGAALAEAFAYADLPDGMNGIILTGPFMPEETCEHLRKIVSRKTHMRVLGFVPEPVSLLQHADRVVAMGGYNTTCEVLSFEKPALIVPRVQPGREQWIRAERLRELGLIDVLHPNCINLDSINRWLSLNITPPFGTRQRINLNGLNTLYLRLEDVLKCTAEPGQPLLFPGFVSTNAR